MTITAVPIDFDDETRPMGAAYDIGADEASGAPSSTACATNCLRVRSIDLVGQAFGSVTRVRATVIVENENGTVVPGASAFVTWHTPTGSNSTTGNTFGAGQAIFDMFNNGTGTYAVTVDDIQLAGSTFDPGGSAALSGTITVP